MLHHKNSIHAIKLTGPATSLYFSNSKVINAIQGTTMCSLANTTHSECHRFMVKRHFQLTTSNNLHKTQVHKL